MSLVTNEERLNPLLVNEKQKSQFTKGLKVLAIDDNVVCLKVLGSFLQKCGYTVTTTRNANEALEMLRKNKASFDIVTTDVVRDDMDGFKLLEAIGLEMDIPVIMTSANGDSRTIVEGIKNGARDYLVKPVKMEDVKNIIQHVTSKNTIEDDHSPISGNDTNESSTLPLKRKGKNSLEYQDEETNTESCGEESCPPRKKNRMRWSKELHQKFLDAYYQLEADSLDKVVPKRILEIMNESGITRENVASHLQKFRNGLKKQNAILNQDSHWKTDSNNIARELPETSNNNMFANPKPCLVPRNQYEQLLPQQNALPVGYYAPISTYPMLDNRIYRPVMDANALSQPDLKRSRRKMDDELLKIPHNYANFGSGQFYQDPVSSAPVSLNYVGTPYQMFGDVSVSPQMTYISSFDSTGLVNSTSGQLEGRDILSFNGRGVPDFGLGANGSPINFSLDDDLGTMVQQFQDISAPRL